MKEQDVERQALARYFPMLRSREEILERIVRGEMRILASMPTLAS